MSDIEIDSEVRQAAAKLIDDDLDFQRQILDAESAMDVRAIVLESFGLPTDRENQLSQQQSAILSEAVSRWSKEHPAGE